MATHSPFLKYAQFFSVWHARSEDFKNRRDTYTTTDAHAGANKTAIDAFNAGRDAPIVAHQASTSTTSLNRITGPSSG
ncbi:hypothetical protein [Janthinobacterium tructae]|uniref:hypothetical protein n=1 Tax=Janthinobacterium tructae TaxID=2590869 RepID=UPI00249ABEF4|nr:hypothetical protein [Janthinobacterium tructae]MDI3292317.1 hypothetical protein [Janthinobacterium tructae]